MTEREQFLYELDGHGYTFKDKSFIDGRFQDDQLNMAWEMWQASVNRPDFVLVPREPTKDTIIKIACVCIGDSFANFEEAKELYKTMIEAVPKEQN